MRKNSRSLCSTQVGFTRCAVVVVVVVVVVVDVVSLQNTTAQGLV
jgi:hypothetical protein